MKDCELCSYPARMYCESDQASLCWDCDEKVHAANFLVARHSRCLLCHVCQSQTPWKVSGLKLGHTVSVCERCVTNCNGKERERCAEEEEIHGRIDEEEDDDDEEEEEDDEEEEEEEVEEEKEEDEEGDNQVVPFSCTPPPPVASSSSSEGESTSRLGRGGGCGGGGGGGGGVSVLKRTREDADLDSDDDIGCCSSQRNYNTISTALTLRAPGDNDKATSTSFRPLKKHLPTTELSLAAPTEEDHDESKSKSNSKAIISSLKRFQQSTISGNNASASILEISKLSRDPRVV